ncbi:Lysosomal alpha-glucosidase, partial [Stegodyphus mimosarum]
MLIFNLYGMSMIGSDICGFRLNTTEELCARWHALGAFYPFSRNHNDYDTIEQDPAAMGETVLKTAKDSLHIRYYLLPYLYTLFYRSHIYGDTVIRPLFFEFPDDKKTYTIDDQFLWGSAVLIMPALYQKVTKIEPYFPRGIWYDFSTGKKYDSKGSTFTMNAAITSINLVVRGGSILPLQEPSETTTASRKNAFDLFVALDEKNEAFGELYWDDGDSLDTYKNDAYNLIQLSAKNNVLISNVVKKGYNDAMNLKEIRIYGVGHSDLNVTINGQPMSVNFTKTHIAIDASGFTLLENLKVIWN